MRCQCTLEDRTSTLATFQLQQESMVDCYFCQAKQIAASFVASYCMQMAAHRGGKVNSVALTHTLTC